FSSDLRKTKPFSRTSAGLAGIYCAAEHGAAQRLISIESIRPMPKNKSFYIIDGHAQIYRAYFAPFRDLNSASGEPTKATFVFTQMLLNLIEQRKPDYLCM